MDGVVQKIVCHVGPRSQEQKRTVLVLVHVKGGGSPLGVRFDSTRFSSFSSLLLSLSSLPSDSVMHPGGQQALNTCPQVLVGGAIIPMCGLLLE